MSAISRKEKVIALLDRCEYQRKTIAGLTYENQRLNEEIKDARAYADKLAAGLPEGMLPKDVEALREANALLAQEVHELREAQRWIPCAERLPDDGISVLALTDGDVVIMYREDIRWCMDQTGAVYAKFAITHWKYLPAGPEVEA